jgi:hypothetical protein
MSTDTIVQLTGRDRAFLADLLGEAERTGRTVSLTVDDGQVKVKIAGSWSQPLGELDPDCVTGRVRAAVARAEQMTRRATVTVAIDPIDDGPHVNFEG